MYQKLKINVCQQFHQKLRSELKLKFERKLYKIIVPLKRNSKESTKKDAQKRNIKDQKKYFGKIPPI
jgi:hypothetical protein